MCWLATLLELLQLKEVLQSLWHFLYFSNTTAQFLNFNFFHNNVICKLCYSNKECTQETGLIILIISFLWRLNILRLLVRVSLGVLFPFQNFPVFLCSHSCSLFISCLTYLPTTFTHIQHPSQRKLKSFSCSHVPYNISSLCSLAPPNPW